jgi:hypothetical protein
MILEHQPTDAETLRKQLKALNADRAQLEGELEAILKAMAPDSPLPLTFGQRERLADRWADLQSRILALKETSVTIGLQIVTTE